MCDSKPKGRAFVGLPTDLLDGLSTRPVPEPEPGHGLVLDSCLAVIPTYLDARDPGVMPDPGVIGAAAAGLRPGVTWLCVMVIVLGRAAGRLPFGVRRPLAVGVTRPLPGVTGVTRPFA